MIYWCPAKPGICVIVPSCVAIGVCIQVRKKKVTFGETKFRSARNCRSEEQTRAQIHPQALAVLLVSTLER